MDEATAARALEVARAAAIELGLQADGADVLQAANRLAIRLTPCDTLVRIAPAAHRWGGDLELDVVRALEGTTAPVGQLDPRVARRVYERDEFVLTFWRYYPTAGEREHSPEGFARALAGLHAGLRAVELPVPHFTHRVAEAEAIVDDPQSSPALAPDERALLSTALKTLRDRILERGAPEQLLHGEPHPGNLLSTREGLLFIDFETCCRGPVEFDVASAPEEVAAHYPGLDVELLGWCRALTVALVAAWRWDRDDHFPDGRAMGIEMGQRLRGLLG